ncbi:hypothetical protein ACFE04_028857 [Oxalis oulophora]
MSAPGGLVMDPCLMDTCVLYYYMGLVNGLRLEELVGEEVGASDLLHKTRNHSLKDASRMKGENNSSKSQSVIQNQQLPNLSASNEIKSLQADNIWQTTDEEMEKVALNFFNRLWFLLLVGEVIDLDGGRDMLASLIFSNWVLDDWVLCRIYNKKGSVEKQQQKTNIIKPPEYLADVSMEEEDKKTEGLFNTTAAAAYGGLPPVPPVSDFMYFGACDSIPRLYTDSSCSEQVVVSPEFTSEAQSEPEWKISTNNAPEEHYNYIDPSLVDNSGPFGSQFNGGEPLCLNTITIIHNHLCF